MVTDTRSIAQVTLVEAEPLAKVPSVFCLDKKLALLRIQYELLNSILEVTEKIVC